MTEPERCPACGAPIPASGRSETCIYCGAQLNLAAPQTAAPQTPAPSGRPDEAGEPPKARPYTPKAASEAEMPEENLGGAAEIARLVSEGRYLEATDQYQYLHNASRSEAEAAIERMKNRQPSQVFNLPPPPRAFNVPPPPQGPLNIPAPQMPAAVKNGSRTLINVLVACVVLFCLGAACSVAAVVAFFSQQGGQF